MNNEKELYLVTYTVHQYVEANSEEEAITEAEVLDYADEITAERLRTT
jgi:hypothetical protein